MIMLDIEKLSISEIIDFMNKKFEMNYNGSQIEKVSESETRVSYYFIKNEKRNDHE